MIPHSSASSQRQSVMDQFAASNGTTSGGRFRNQKQNLTDTIDQYHKEEEEGDTMH